MPIVRRIDSLRLKTGQPIDELWFDSLADVLEDIAEEGAVTYEGYVNRTLKPIEDSKISLGAPNARFADGFFVDVKVFDELEVAGKKAMFEGDVNVYSNLYAYSAFVSYSLYAYRADVVELDVHDELSAKAIKVYDAEVARKLNASVAEISRLSVIEGVNLGYYSYGYSASFVELDVDDLVVENSISVPDYSIGFIKIDPRLASSAVRTIDVPANGVKVFPRGVYYANLPAGVSVEVNFGGTWLTYATATVCLVISDGANVRLNNTNATSVSVSVVQIR